MNHRAHRRVTMRGLRRLQRLLGDCAGAPGRDGAGALVSAALVDLLDLEDCWFVHGPIGPSLPQLDSAGRLSLRVQRGNLDGTILPPAVALPAPGGDHFVLVGRAGVGVSAEQRLIAAIMASAVATAPGPPNARGGAAERRYGGDRSVP